MPEAEPARFTPSSVLPITHSSITLCPMRSSLPPGHRPQGPEAAPCPIQSQIPDRKSKIEKFPLPDLPVSPSSQLFSFPPSSPPPFYIPHSVFTLLNSAFCPLTPETRHLKPAAPSRYAPCPMRSAFFLLASRLPSFPASRPLFPTFSSSQFPISFFSTFPLGRRPLWPLRLPARR